MVVYKAQILQAMHPRAVYYLWLRHKNLREIAQCMHVIAMAGLHKLNSKSGQKYFHLYFIKELFKGSNVSLISDIVSINEVNTGDYKTDHVLNSVDRFLIIYITSDKSCSGLINGGIYRIVNSLVENIKFKHKSVRLISIGKKGYGIFKRRFKSSFFKVFLDLDFEKNSFLACSVLVYKFMKLKFDKGLILFNRYINPSTQIVSYYNFFSFSFLLKKISLDQHKNRFFQCLNGINSFDDYSLLDLYRFCMTIVLMDSLKENIFSEIAARARVMENIIQNLDILINMFWINYQKTRQRRITDEIIEILNGANVANEYSVDARNEALEKEQQTVSDQNPIYESYEEHESDQDSEYNDTVYNEVIYNSNNVDYSNVSNNISEAFYLSKVCSDDLMNVNYSPSFLNEFISHVELSFLYFPQINFDTLELDADDHSTDEELLILFSQLNNNSDEEEFNFDDLEFTLDLSNNNSDEDEDEEEFNFDDLEFTFDLSNPVEASQYYALKGALNLVDYPDPDYPETDSSDKL